MIPGSDALTSASRVTLVDQLALAGMADAFDNSSAAASFVLDFTLFWNERYSRLEDAVNRGCISALDAALSVSSTASMVGARRLAHLAETVEQSIRLNDLEGAAKVLPLMSACGRQTINELSVRFCPPPAQL